MSWNCQQAFFRHSVWQSLIWMENSSNFALAYLSSIQIKSMLCSKVPVGADSFSKSCAACLFPFFIFVCGISIGDLVFSSNFLKFKMIWKQSSHGKRESSGNQNHHSCVVIKKDIICRTYGLPFNSDHFGYAKEIRPTWKINFSRKNKLCFPTKRLIYLVHIFRNVIKESWIFSYFSNQ